MGGERSDGGALVQGVGGLASALPLSAQTGRRARAVNPSLSASVSRPALLNVPSCSVVDSLSVCSCILYVSAALSVQ